MVKRSARKGVPLLSCRRAIARHDAASQRTPERRARTEQLKGTNVTNDRSRGQVGGGRAREPPESTRRTAGRRTKDPKNRENAPTRRGYAQASTAPQARRRGTKGDPRRASTTHTPQGYIRGVPWGRPKDGHAPQGLHPERHSGCDQREQRNGRGGHRRAPNGEPMTDETVTDIPCNILFVPFINSVKNYKKFAYINIFLYLCTEFLN